MTADKNSSIKVKQAQKSQSSGKSAEESNEELSHNDEKEKEEEGKNDNEIPKGKVSCLLCRGFISYKNSDRSRFRDHMESEHDVKFDSDIILAVSVMSAAEKKFIIESAVKRLGEISFIYRSVKTYACYKKGFDNCPMAGSGLVI